MFGSALVMQGRWYGEQGFPNKNPNDCLVMADIMSSFLHCHMRRSVQIKFFWANGAEVSYVIGALRKTLGDTPHIWVQSGSGD